MNKSAFNQCFLKILVPADFSRSEKRAGVADAHGASVSADYIRRDSHFQEWAKGGGDGAMPGQEDGENGISDRLNRLTISKSVLLIGYELYPSCTLFTIFKKTGITLWPYFCNPGLASIHFAQMVSVTATGILKPRSLAVSLTSRSTPSAIASARV